MDERNRKIAEKFKELVSKSVNVQEIIVFGSRARGDFSNESGLDVLVVAEYLDHSTERYISECAWEAGFPEDIVVVSVAVSSDSVKNGPLRESVFIRNVYRDGIRI